MGSEWLIGRVLDWMIRFIDTLYIQIGITSNYSAIADLHTLQFTVSHALGFSVFTSRNLATDLCLTVTSNRTEVFFAPPNSFLDIILQLPNQFNSSPPKLISRQDGVSKLESIPIPLNWTLLYNHFARTTQKAQSLYR
jgi:hypothetical protein